MFTATILFCAFTANAEPLECEVMTNRLELFTTEEQCLQDIMTYINQPVIRALAEPPDRISPAEVKCVEWKTKPQASDQGFS
jgi:hypothetical protein